MIQDEIARTIDRLCKAVNAAIPPGSLRAKVELTLDAHGAQVHNCAISFRPPQPKAGMGEQKM